MSIGTCPVTHTKQVRRQPPGRRELQLCLRLEEIYAVWLLVLVVASAEMSCSMTCFLVIMLFSLCYRTHLNEHISLCFLFERMPFMFCAYLRQL
ncbi:hypothetical protein Patl1_13244 [Pistacia atlantica]|uniref:Uncharacterized protein n=1 Tax=Pistacia atlantica TaxID=434234 RepID=A0ACC1ATJ1_9ROSI|nr:hypothetical protein Patl1_13244 [Pistacia atlantica]